MFDSLVTLDVLETHTDFYTRTANVDHGDALIELVGNYYDIALQLPETNPFERFSGKSLDLI